MEKTTIVKGAEVNAQKFLEYCEQYITEQKKRLSNATTEREQLLTKLKIADATLLQIHVRRQTY